MEGGLSFNIASKSYIYQQPKALAMVAGNETGLLHRTESCVGMI